MDTAGYDYVTDGIYVPYVIKRYKHFTLLLNNSPHYLGQAVVWLARPGSMQRYSSLYVEELTELGEIAREYEKAVQELWQPDHMNYTWLGNLFNEHAGHGHMHLIPRYKEEREFDGVIFKDGKWGHNPYGSLKPEISEAAILSMVELLRNKLS